MSGRPPETPVDSYRYGPEEIAEFEERFRLEPVAPETIEARAADGAVLVTVDIPSFLDRGLANPTDTSIALYRLVQLFGTPNVPGLEAGAEQPEREAVTWQYLFRLVDAPEDGPTREYLISVYDYKTDLSVGISGWVGVEVIEDGNDGRIALEPTDEPVGEMTMPEEDPMTAVVQLVLSSVNHAVPATYRDLHV